MTGDNNLLRSLAERRIRLEDERDALSADITEINGEAKAHGYTPRTFSQAIKIARMTPEKREQYDNGQMELSLYLDALDGGSE